MLLKKYKVILDTNFLMIPHQYAINIFAEIKRIMDVPYKLCVIDKTFEELNKHLILGKKEERKAAKLGIALASELIKQKSLKILTSSSKKSVDDIIVSKAGRKVLVATVDKELKQRVKAAQGGIITLKQKKYLVRE